ncbi:sensor domain-containing protein [Mycolicibacter senuensis]|nr:sensor domain-containing protein [Mycolicibacter senuensis]
MNRPQGLPPDPYDRTRFAPGTEPIPPSGGPFPPPGAAFPPAGGPFPPHWPPGPPPPPPRSNRPLIWLLMGLVCVLTAVLVTVILVGRDRNEIAQTPTATSKPAPAKTSAPAGHAPLPVSALDGLLPDRGFISSTVGASGIDVVARGENIDVEDLVDVDCQGVVSVASRAYLGSGWTAIRWQNWSNPPDINAPRFTNRVGLSVTIFPQADAARAFYGKQSAAWRKCANRIVNGHPVSAKEVTDQIWVVGEVTVSDRVVATTATSALGPDWSCRHLLSVRNNVAVRAVACGRTDPTAAAQTILDSIIQKIDAAA